VTRTATLRRWSTRLRPKLRELALAVADIAKAISLTLVSKEWGTQHTRPHATRIPAIDRIQRS
jgi:hypothetical protein